jgi:hypothetical protein
MRLSLIALAILGMSGQVPAFADTTTRIVTPKGYVAFIVGDDWAALSVQSKLPVASAVYQIPNPADAGTPESTNLALVLYDLTTKRGQRRFASPVTMYGEGQPVESQIGAWTVYRQKGKQNGVPYTIVDAVRKDVGEVAASVRLAWPRLPGNDAKYDEQMEHTLRSFLASVQGHVGPWTPREDEVIHRPREGQ